MMHANLGIDVLLLVSAPEKSTIFRRLIPLDQKNPIILLFFLLWLLWWARARHEGNPLIKEDIFGQECGGLGYQDENINEFLFLKHNLRRCLAKNVASKLLRWKYIWGAASPSNLLSKKIFIKLHEWLFGCEGRRYIWGSWEMILGERPRAGQRGDFVNWTNKGW